MKSAPDVVQNAACPDRWSSTGNGIARPDRHHKPVASLRRRPENRRHANKAARPIMISPWNCWFKHKLAATQSSAVIKSP
jgi:hypothetical protein